MDYCNTQYTGKEAMETDQILPLVIINCVMIVFNVVVNATLIFSMIRTNQIRTMSLRFIVYLSTFDMCIGVIVQLLVVIMLTNFLIPTTDCRFESVASFLGIFISHLSGYMTFVIGFDRFARIKYLTTYSRRFENRRTEVLLLVFVVFASAVQASIHTLGSQQVMRIKTARVISLTVDLLLIISMIFSYVRSIFVMRRHRKSAHNAKLLKQVNKRFTRVASRILLAILIFYGTYIVILIGYQAVQVTPDNAKWLVFTKFIGFIVFYCNAVVNALIFISSNAKVKNYFRNTFCFLKNAEDNSVSGSSNMELTPVAL